MIIVDSTVWTDYLAGTVNPHTDRLDRELNQQRLGLTDLILCEILQRIRGDSRASGVTCPTSRCSTSEARLWRWPPLRTIGLLDQVAIQFAKPSTA
jgi:hypothetical protein